VHTCPRPGCNVRIDDRLFACRNDWYALSSETRRWIWRSAKKKLVDRDRMRAVKQALTEWKAREILVKVHEIAKDGLPDMDQLTGRVAFIWDGEIVSGWPLNKDEDGSMLWRGAEDLFMGPFYGVTHWVEFPVPVRDLEKSE
jgi:hypothetical protein